MGNCSEETQRSKYTKEGGIDNQLSTFDTVIKKLKTKSCSNRTSKLIEPLLKSTDKYASTHLLLTYVEKFS